MPTPNPASLPLSPSLPYLEHTDKDHEPYEDRCIEHRKDVDGLGEGWVQDGVGGRHKAAHEEDQSEDGEHDVLENRNLPRVHDLGQVQQGVAAKGGGVGGREAAAGQREQG